jgi:hypothetical protein
MKYKLVYITPDKIRLTFSIDSYEIVNGTLIRFYDDRKKETKLIPVSNVEIKVIGDEKRYSI